MTLTYECRECGKEFDVNTTPIVPARVSGPPEDCYPEEGGEIEPDECECGEPVERATVMEMLGDAIEDAKLGAAEAREERRKEERYMDDKSLD